MKLTFIEIENFIQESWKIEGIVFGKLDLIIQNVIIDNHRIFLQKHNVSMNDLCNSALLFTSNRGILRDKVGLDVRVGNYLPPKGGTSIKSELKKIVENINNNKNPYDIHIRFETLHPFLDANGRIGRMIWLKQTIDQNTYNPHLLFLHHWYYQSLQNSRL